MKNPYFDSTQGKIKMFNFRNKVLGTHAMFQQLLWVPL